TGGQICHERRARRAVVGVEIDRQDRPPVVDESLCDRASDAARSPRHKRRPLHPHSLLSRSSFPRAGGGRGLRTESARARTYVPARGRTPPREGSREAGPGSRTGVSTDVLVCGRGRCSKSCASPKRRRLREGGLQTAHGAPASVSLTTTARPPWAV